jgi:hypothetical protein
MDCVFMGWIVSVIFVDNESACCWFVTVKDIRVVFIVGGGMSTMMVLF